MYSRKGFAIVDDLYEMSDTAKAIVGAFLIALFGIVPAALLFLGLSN